MGARVRTCLRQRQSRFFSWSLIKVKRIIGDLGTDRRVKRVSLQELTLVLSCKLTCFDFLLTGLSAPGSPRMRRVISNFQLLFNAL